ncbi:GntR family transcriptional regulator [Kordiimonas marina]|uniref:GntR family transcriptional regulator n=1 Tax=Kordiimonas marina TaxID=2872312 RepID=UPI001FF2D393|nr:GntR family transcriptional regulator [Kordiimonas marina]MCJ9430677.1 GntR family transcriptional regulator [Kordiimonas marina]
MAKAPLVERKSLAVQVADALRDMILSGSYDLGEQLRQEEVAKKLGVSRIPVREAFQQLEAEGLVVNVPYKGTVVSRLTLAEIDEFFDIRATLECELLGRALDNMTEDTFTRARRAVERMDAASPAKWSDHNWQFHAELYSPANRPNTLDLVKKIHGNVDRYVRIQLSLSEENRLRANEEHSALIDLCEQKSRDAALKLLRDHIADAKDDLLDHLKEND